MSDEERREKLASAVAGFAFALEELGFAFAGVGVDLDEDATIDDLWFLSGSLTREQGRSLFEAWKLWDEQGTTVFAREVRMRSVRAQ